MYWKIQLPYAFSDQNRRFDEFFGEFFDDFFSESGGNFALQSAPLLTEFSEYALLAVTHVKFKQTVLYDFLCRYLELFNYWNCLVFYDIFWYLTLISYTIHIFSDTCVWLEKCWNGMMYDKDGI
jgi:hypothetical protein